MEIRKSNENFKDGKPKCFNCEIYGHITRDCKKQKKRKTLKNAMSVEEQNILPEIVKQSRR